MKKISLKWFGEISIRKREYKYVTVNIQIGGQMKKRIAVLICLFGNIFSCRPHLGT